ncbi:metal-dependent hydrolase [Bacillus phage P59]|nr:metal-dependent hydrolase [Bacillus phage P59]
MIKLKMIGTGSAFAKKFYNNSALITTEQGYKLLIDCGHSVPKGLHEQGMSLEDVDGILVTHLHNDHIGGLEEAALYNMFNLGGRKMDLFVPVEILDDLWDKSLSAGLEPGGFLLDDYFNVRPLHLGHSFHLYGNVMTLYPTKHVNGMFSVAVGFDRTLFYSSDSVFDADLIKIADKYSNIFHDCQLEGVGAVHSTLEELLKLPTKVQMKTYLMHYGDNMATYKGQTGDMEFAIQGRQYFLRD